MSSKVNKKLRNAKKRAEAKTLDIADYMDENHIKEEKFFTIEGANGETRTIRIDAEELKPKIERQVEIDEKVVRSGPPYHFTVKNVFYDVKLPELLEYFNFANVKESTIKRSGPSARLGEFILMVNTVEELKACLARHGQFFMGRDITIELFKDKYQRRFESTSTFMSRYHSYENDGGGGLPDDWQTAKMNREPDFYKKDYFSGYKGRQSNNQSRSSYSTAPIAQGDWNEHKKSLNLQENNYQNNYNNVSNKRYSNSKPFSEVERIKDWNLIKKDAQLEESNSQYNSYTDNRGRWSNNNNSLPEAEQVKDWNVAKQNMMNNNMDIDNSQYAGNNRYSSDQNYSSRNPSQISQNAQPIDWNQKKIEMLSSGSEHQTFYSNYRQNQRSTSNKDRDFNNFKKPFYKDNSRGFHKNENRPSRLTQDWEKAKKDLFISNNNVNSSNQE